LSNGQRAFRGEDSIAAEKLTRDAIAPFLASRGYEIIEDRRKGAGSATEQFVSVRAPDGSQLQMRVRLCWRREGRNANGHKFAAAQLRARLIKDSWEDTLDFIVRRDREHGNTHNLIVQRDGAAIVYAALIPRDELSAIWFRQRDVSADLQRRGLLGKMSKNHAMNGTSPTIWLQDDRTKDAHEVADVLWNWTGVIDLAKLEASGNTVPNDTLDDCPGIDYSLMGSDGAARRSVVRSAVQRDPKVRMAVLARTTGCERSGCVESKRYPGFLDVHHILGADKGDRVWNCVALCPNCHREAHFAPNADSLNQQLLAYAQRFLG
jgi:5-methylcytosine-specific restriction enzyme A